MKKIAFAFIFTLTLFGCQKKAAIIQNPERLADIQQMLSVQKTLTAKSTTPIWSIFDTQLTPDEKSSLEFIYAYMPLSDLADYSPDFFLKNIRFSLKAREEMAWGKTIPEQEFLHFVLPLRVNNENLDNFREEMYNEITQRVKGMSMKEAALEINHWCHEKVSYRGTDIRTSAPLSTVKKTFGRCGEESTFAVTALRTAGIPARQVYTPRWAHSDDNHAWVEVWIDGKWHYLGACEPDVDLDMGWFSEPARRAMLVHTRAYGKYFGNEAVITPADRFSELNLTANYAAVKNITIKVKDEKGLVVDSAKVEFQLYNYAEYYPIASGYTNPKGETSLITGMGDLIVWAAKNGKIGYHKISVPETDTLTITLDKNKPTTASEAFDFIPPHAAKVESTVSDDARKANSQRLSAEDSIRNAYMKTFKDSAWSAQLAAKLGLPATEIANFIHLSYGNWDQISAYFEKNSAEFKNTVVELAKQISNKDFSDASEEILTDHLVTAAKNSSLAQGISPQIYNQYILAPRIGNENLTAWRSFLTTAFDQPTIDNFRKDINTLTDWVRQNITINEVANKHSRTPISPKGVFNLKVSDAISRDIFFVAVCRTIGIPARLNPASRTPEYYKNGTWLKTEFDVAETVQPEKGNLKLLNDNNLVMPQYSLHFTIRMLKKGFYQTLDFEEGAKISDLAQPISLEVGDYVLVTGNRLEDGSVLSSMTTFAIEKGKTTPVTVTLRQQSGELKPSGKLDFAHLMLLGEPNKAAVAYQTLANGGNSVVVLLDPDKEPSKHILNDLGPYIDHFNKWGGQFIFAMPAEKAAQAGVLKTYALPTKNEVGIDQNNALFDAISAQYGTGLKDKLPLVMFCNAQGEIFLFSSGYKIGIGEQLLKVIATLNSNAKATNPKASCVAP